MYAMYTVGVMALEGNEFAYGTGFTTNELVIVLSSLKVWCPDLWGVLCEKDNHTLTVVLGAMIKVGLDTHVGFDCKFCGLVEDADVKTSRDRLSPEVADSALVSCAVLLAPSLFKPSPPLVQRVAVVNTRVVSHPRQRTSRRYPPYVVPLPPLPSVSPSFVPKLSPVSPVLVVPETPPTTPPTPNHPLFEDSPIPPTYSPATPLSPMPVPPPPPLVKRSVRKVLRGDTKVLAKRSFPRMRMPMLSSSDSSDSDGCDTDSDTEHVFAVRGKRGLVVHVPKKCKRVRMTFNM